MTYEQIEQVNKTIKTTPIKGKEYAEVPQRIKAFRMLYPEGFIRTEIISLADGVVVMKAEVGISDIVLATGTAYEKETSSFINKTSYIENCETSAVGRALGMLGLGIDTSVASKEEVENAINNQNTNQSSGEICPDNAKKRLWALLKKSEKDPVAVFKKYGATYDKLTVQQYNDIARGELNEG